MNFSFCKQCQCYHVNWSDKSNNLDQQYETHLTPEERAEAFAFPVYRKRLNGFYAIFTYFIQPRAMPGFIEWLKQNRDGDPFEARKLA